MPTYHVQMVLEAESGLGADAIVNTWTVDGDGTGSGAEADGIEIDDAISAFYNQLAVDDVLGGWWTGELNTFVYLINPSDPTLGSPVYVNSGTVGSPPGNNSLPLEVAIALSFAGPPLIGVPAARRRGRVFLGPIATSALDFGATIGPRPSSATMTDISDAFATMGTALGSALLPLQIWSRAEGEVFPAVRWWIDNEVDTMRSRGLRATTRVSGP